MSERIRNMWISETGRRQESSLPEPIDQSLGQTALSGAEEAEGAATDQQPDTEVVTGSTKACDQTWGWWK